MSLFRTIRNLQRQAANEETEADAYRLELEAEAERVNYKKNPSTSGGSGEPPEEPSTNGVGGAYGSYNDPAVEWAESGRFQDIYNSSNVYAIAYNKRTQTLYVQYYHWEKDMEIGARDGPGAIYKYSNQSLEQAVSFYRAVSAGTWVWNNLRIRGTWSQHQCPYELVKIQRDYLPRKATLRRDGEWFIPRRLQDDAGNIRKSTLPKMKPKPPGYYEDLRHEYEERNNGYANFSRGNAKQANRNLPDNGKPDKPNNGKPKK